MDFGGHLIEAALCLVVPDGQAFVLFAVFLLVLRDMGVLVNAVLNESRTRPSSRTSSALSAFDFAGEVPDAAVAVPARTASFKLYLYLVKDRRIDDCLMGVFFLCSVCSTKPPQKSRKAVNTCGERFRCFEFNEMAGI